MLEDAADRKAIRGGKERKNRDIQGDQGPSQRCGDNARDPKDLDYPDERSNKKAWELDGIPNERAWCTGG